MYIVRAAIMYSNGVVEGRAYGHIESLARKLGFTGDKVEGFLTTSGEFVLPQEAAKIAFDSGQIKEAKDTLTPDQLWPQGMILE